MGRSLSAKTIERLVGQVGQELGQRGESPATEKTVVAPEVAVVSCDGGRIQTRQPGHGPGVHGEKWRETKNASFERMSVTESSAVDPCPALPDTFRKVAHVAQIAEKAAIQATCCSEKRSLYRGPKRILRTCLSSLVSSSEFGLQMRHEAQRRKLFEAKQRVFIGDGLGWNWTIWREHFRTFTPILDFIHAVQYVYAAALAWEATDSARWNRYLQMIEAVWQGEVVNVVNQLQAELLQRGVHADTDVPEEHPLRALLDAARYLRNNAERMNYPTYRRAGLPITSAPMESLIKQMNLRVKGTEMFWNDPHGAEPILQLRAASLCEDGRLDDYLRQRPGCSITRRPRLATAA